LSFFGLSIGYLTVSLASNNFGKGAFQFYFWVIAGISLLWARSPQRPKDAAPTRYAIPPDSASIATGVRSTSSVTHTERTET
jgi:hypothetical protein